MGETTAKSTNKNQMSLLNAITAFTMTIVNGLFGIVVTRMVIGAYGSDFNGLNSTANQIVNVLLVLEGGFTMASNVALFAPLTAGDYTTVNGLLAATQKAFHRIGVLFLSIGCVASVAYGFVVNSDLPIEFVVTVILMTVIPAAFNLFYATTYRVLLQAQQREYVINIITTLTLGLGHMANIVMIHMAGPMWMVRFNTMVCALLNSFLIVLYVKRKVNFLNLATPQRPELIKGTQDVMVQRITGVIYNSAPIVFLSISSTGGTLLASVYAVYNNVFVMLKTLLHGFIDAPRLGFGQMLTEKKREEVWPVFAQYEFAAFLITFVMMSTGCALIMPFISLYMDGITDINYHDSTIAVLMVSISVVEMLHIPSGHLINMAGEFRISKNFQLVSCVVLLATMAVGGSLWGIYGMLTAILLVAVLLAILEIGYVHTCFFCGKMGKLIRLLIPVVAIGVALCYLEMRLPLEITEYLSFAVYGILLTVVNSVAIAFVGYAFNRKELSALLIRVWRFLPLKGN